jgi:FtsH-binding integral membrane protein
MNDDDRVLGAVSDPCGIELPGIHDAANEVSRIGQKTYVLLSGSRLCALLLAAVAGAAASVTRGFDYWGLALLIGFAGAAVAEFALIRFQPERDWYSGRAIAESVKTLAWRYAVQAEPFGPAHSDKAADDLLIERIRDVLRRGRDRIDIEPGQTVITESMRALRAESMERRREVYLRCRTEDQQRWYSSRARKNAKSATYWRYALLAGEVLAVALAAVALGRSEPADFAGIIAAAVASGAAWLSLKQYSQLTSAYRVAATELALQADILRAAEVGDWPSAVADAEEAISREHTMWLASRGEEAIGGH